MRTGVLAGVASLALLAAAAGAAQLDPQPCPRCADPDNQGLCHSERCREQVLPQLTEPAWYRDAHSGPFWKKAAAPKSRATEHAARMAEQSGRRASSYRRLGRALDGYATKTRRRRQVA
jgi:hypothetical protein